MIESMSKDEKEALKTQRIVKIEAALCNFIVMEQKLNDIIKYMDKKKLDYGIYGQFVKYALEDKHSEEFKNIDLIVAADVENILNELKIEFTKDQDNYCHVKTDSININIWSKDNHFAFAKQLCNKKWKNISKTSIITNSSLFYLRTMKNKLWTEGYDLFYDKNHRVDFYGFKQTIAKKQNIGRTLVEVSMVLVEDPKAFLAHKLCKWIKPMIGNPNLKSKMAASYKELYNKEMTDAIYDNMVRLVKAQKLNQR